MYTKNYPAKELIDNGSHEKNYAVAVEDTIELYVNKRSIAAILATPEMIKELAFGHLICEGIVKNPDEIKEVRMDGKTIHIEIEPAGHLLNPVFKYGDLRSSGCMGVKWDEKEAITVRSDTEFKADTIKKSLVFLESEVYRETRGTHAACLVDTEGVCVAKAVDVGRHNAFDKVIGRAYLEGMDVSSHFLLSTGRQSAGMVLKAARAGIPLVATKTGPLNTGIDAAERTGVCLVCFVSSGKMSVFTHPERLR
jgi:FdhD protein